MKKAANRRRASFVGVGLSPFVEAAAVALGMSNSYWEDWNVPLAALLGHLPTVVLLWRREGRQIRDLLVEGTKTFLVPLELRAHHRTWLVAIRADHAALGPFSDWLEEHGMDDYAQHVRNLMALPA